MAEEISKPLCAVRKVTMVSSGDGQVGAAKLSGEVLDMMTCIPEALEKLTGVSISQVTHLCRLRRRILSSVHLSPISCVGELMFGRPRCRFTFPLLPGPPASLKPLTPSPLLLPHHCGGHKLHFLVFMFSLTC